MLGLCGIPWREALHELPAALGNQLLACHWMSRGIEIESITHAVPVEDRHEAFEQLTTRSHSWDSALH